MHTIDFTLDAAPPRSPFRRPPVTSRAGFTLLEVMIATTILGIALSMTLVVYLASLKRAKHTELTLKGAAELRYAVDVISQAVRSAPQLPTVQDGGLELVVPPKDLGSATVLETTWIDMVNDVKGSKSNQRMLHVSDITEPAVVSSVWAGSARPAGALATSDVATYFVSAASLPTTDLRDLFSVGDTITIPETAYGPQTTGIINSISNNSGNKTVTLTSNLGVDVPNGTKIAATSGRRILFEVVASGANQGDLRYYPDSRDTSTFTVLAHDISPAPLTDPADTTSAATVPFTIPTASTDYVILNLQKIPAGTMVGRTLEGVQTAVFTRTDPTIE